MSIFDGINFFCAPTLSDERKSALTLLLERNGAQPVPLEEATHIITLSLDFEGQDNAKEGSVIVTDYWVDRSLIVGRLQQVQHFSPDPTMLFSGVIGCATDLVSSDIEVLSAGITALGGQWRAGLTLDVTHLFAIGPGSEKYRTALRYQKKTKVKVLVPHWFDDSVRLGIRALSTLAYEWPEPTILTSGKPNAETSEVGDRLLRPQNKLSQDKKALYRAALMTAEQEAKLGQAETRDIWGHRRILLGPDLELSDGRRQAIEAGIARLGGVVVDFDAQRVDAEYEFDVLIARYRWGSLYVQGVKGRRLIGSLSWLFHVESTGTIGTPTAQLLHYPIPKRPVDGFSAHEITVTNYTGDARDYLKKLIGLMGATFTPSMSGKNTVLIAAYISGNKATKARNWSIPVVNHTWLEDCFIQWKNLSVGLEKYVVFPPGLDFADHLGERGLQREVILEMVPALVAEMAFAQEKVTPEGKQEAREGVLGRGGTALSPRSRRSSIHRSEGNSTPTTKRRPSTRLAKAEDGGPEAENQMDVGARSQPTGDQGVGEDRMEVDGPEPSLGSMPSPEPKHARRTTRRARESSSPLRQHITPTPRRTSGGPSSARRRRHRANSETAEEEVASPTNTRSVHAKSAATGSPVRRTSKRVRGATPLRMESVLMPPPNETGEALGRSPQRQTRPVKAKPKGRRASSSRSESIAAERAPPPLSSLTVDTTTDRDEGPSSRRALSRRSAANKATQRLREEVMPDVVNFEKEMRRGHVRAASQHQKNEQGEESGKGKGKGKGKKRAASSIQHPSVEDDGASSDSEHAREHKKRRLSGPKAGDRIERHDDDDDEQHLDAAGASSSLQETVENPSSKGGGRKGAKVKKALSFGGISSGKKSVGILATQVTLDESEEKALAKLGARVGVKPEECTHLVVRTLARTEKLLCAMAMAPAVVTEKWVRDSIAAKKLLPTDKYVLADPTNEKKWKFKLADALKRAKSRRGQLFAGKVFYVTSKVPVDKKLLKNVVSSNGGQLRLQNPTVRVLSGGGGGGGKGSSSSGHHHHQPYVISCPEDVSIWRPIAEAGHAIYSHELILSAALTQEMRLNAEGVRID